MNVLTGEEIAFFVKSEITTRCELGIFMVEKMIDVSYKDGKVFYKLGTQTVSCEIQEGISYKELYDTYIPIIERCVKDVIIIFLKKALTEKSLLTN